MTHAAVTYRNCSAQDFVVLERFGDDWVMARGVVKFFKSEKGWGAISCDELPDGQDAWVHFSNIEATGYRALDGGDIVDFDYEEARQDSFNFRATRVQRLESGPAPILRRTGTRVVVAAAETPDTPLTPRRHRDADSTATDSSGPDSAG